VGPAIIVALYKSELVKDVADLYRLSIDPMLKLERMGSLLATKLLGQIESSKNRPLRQFLTALGIDQVGWHVAELLTSKYHSIEDFFAVTEDDLQILSGIGPSIAKSVVVFFRQPQTRRLIDKLRQDGLRLEEEAPMQAGALPWQGKTFVFTGTLAGFTREQAERIVKELGGEATSSVSSQTDFVVAGDKPGSKVDRAQTLGIRILKEEEFVAMLEETKR
jgi:DNA ligase (NAD+)